MTSLKFILAAGISTVAFSSAAMAGDLVIAEAPAAAYSAGNFDGAFIGVFGGGALSELEFPLVAEEFAFLGLSPEGWMLGVDAGFNFSLGNGLVLGIVGDIAWADLTDDSIFFEGPAFGSTIDWVGSLRARAGFDAGNFMPYLTAGLAAAHNTLEANGELAEEFGSVDATHVGWTIGAGVEFAVADNLSIDANYRYNDYGSADYAVIPEDDAPEFGVGLTSHQLTVGLHYGF